jgi:hypothetical protein
MAIAERRSQALHSNTFGTNPPGRLLIDASGSTTRVN